MNRGALLVGLGLALAAAGCTGAAGSAGPTASPPPGTPTSPATGGTGAPASTSTPPQSGGATPAVTASATPTASSPAVTAGSPSASPARTSVYADTGPGDVSRVAAAARPLVYVPNSVSNTVSVIDPATLKVVSRFPVGREPQHVVPSWDLKTLFVNDDQSNDLVPIDPLTGRRGPALDVADPYNLYFTPDGRHALVMAERLRRIDVRDPHTMRLQRSIVVPCRGVNHADFTADGRFMLASCEYSGELLVIPVDTLSRVTKVIDLNRVRTPGATSPQEAKRMGGPATLISPGVSAMPQDVRTTSDGASFVVADMIRNGVWVIDAKTFTVTRFVPTGAGAHGIYPSRDATRLFVSNRDGASVSVLDATAQRVLTTWPLAAGASPDMGGVSVDGTRLWLSGRYDSQVYVIDTRSGRTIATIPVGKGPHGLLVWPQPGQHSLGHTGNMR